MSTDTQVPMFVNTQHGQQPNLPKADALLRGCGMKPITPRPDFPVPTLPLARPSDPQTSRDAAADLMGTERLGEAQLAALNLVLLFPGENAAELERLTKGEAARSTHKRLRELSRTGWLFNAGTKVDPKTGKAGLRWWPSKKAAAWAKTRHVASATGAVLASVLLAATLIACATTPPTVGPTRPLSAR